MKNCKICGLFKRTRLKPFSNWNEEQLERIIVKHINQAETTKQLKTLSIMLVREAFDSDGWKVKEDFNGCTIVQDFKQPSFACMVHDYMWITGHGGKMADFIFYHLMLAEGMPEAKAKRRWLAVRSGWYLFFMWKYIFQKKFMKPTPAMIELNDYLNSKYYVLFGKRTD